MILALDTYYFENKAKTVALEFSSWSDNIETVLYSEVLENIEEYISGEFYKRELPCILSLISKIDVKKIEFIIIDGYVFVDDNSKLGLGGFLYEKLSKKIPIIGVAKTDFISLTKNKISLLRGKSKNPLFISSIGINLNEATEKIKQMSGEFRIPTLLKKLDTLTKEK
jgi:deoxyribonuclease V